MPMNHLIYFYEMKISRLRLAFIFILFGSLSFNSLSQSWKEDILKNGYEMRYVNLPDDYSGKVRSTIIRKRSGCDNKRAILYIHGYNDYFFQKELGNRMVDSCYNFYAVDLRKYGRSIIKGQTKFQAHNLDEYYADIDSAVSQIKRDGNDKIIIMGHSTGGLISSLYMNHPHDKAIKGVILNSPFLEWNMSWFLRKIVIPIVRFLSKIFPNLAISQGESSPYAESLLKQFHGEWEYNTDWKTVKPQPVQASWINAISYGQQYLHNKSDIAEPILLMHSSKSVGGDSWNPEYQNGDGVLNVDHISKYGNKLGGDVTEVTIVGGLHDLILSKPEVRENAYEQIFNWLKANNF